MLIRDSRNPVLVALPNSTWCNKKVYNCAIYKEGDTYRMLFRAVGDDWISRLGLAESADGISFTINPSPVFSPANKWDTKGCEDPRIVKLDGTYYVTYTAFDGVTARAALTSSRDLLNWNERIVLFRDWENIQRENLPANWSKSAAIFPKKINDKFYIFFGDNHIWAAVSDNLKDWHPLKSPILSAREGHFDSAYIEMGPPPILTSRGWLVLYHGVNTFDSQRIYSLGAALTDINDPLKVIWRRSTPILEPTEPYEVMGLIDIVDGGFNTLKNVDMSYIENLASENRLPKAIFCCGALLEGDTVRLYYGAADTVISTATINLATIFED